MSNGIISTIVVFFYYQYSNNAISEGNMLYLWPDKKARQVIVGPRAAGPRANNHLEGLFGGP